MPIKCFEAHLAISKKLRDHALGADGCDTSDTSPSIGVPPCRAHPHAIGLLALVCVRSVAVGAVTATFSCL